MTAAGLALTASVVLAGLSIWLVDYEQRVLLAVISGMLLGLGSDLDPERELL